MKTELNKNEKLSTEQETPPIANVLLAADADYWITAPPEEVKKYLSDNLNMKEYELKKQKLLCEIQKKLK